MGLFAVALVAALVACSDDDPKSDSPSDGDPTSSVGSPSGTSEPSVTEVTVDCPEFAETAKKIVEAQAELYAPGGDAGQAIDDLLVELESLKEGAPEDVQQALTDLGSGFEDAAALLEDPTRQNQARLVALAEQLAEDGEKVTGYITEQCGG
jgi:hypothetical protein